MYSKIEHESASQPGLTVKIGDKGTVRGAYSYDAGYVEVEFENGYQMAMDPNQISKNPARLAF